MCQQRIISFLLVLCLNYSHIESIMPGQKLPNQVANRSCTEMRPLLATDSKDLPKEARNISIKNIPPLRRKQVSSVSIVLGLPFFPSCLEETRCMGFLFVLHTYVWHQVGFFFSILFVNNLLGHFFIKLIILGCCHLFFGTCCMVIRYTLKFFHLPIKDLFLSKGTTYLSLVAGVIQEMMDMYI